MIKVRAGGPVQGHRPGDAHRCGRQPAADAREGALVLCRCGRSRTKPYCDRSHRTAPGSTAASTPACPPPARASRTCRARCSPPRTTSPATPRAAGAVLRARGNPTWARWEAALGELEGGEAVAFASGMAAISAVLLTALGPGDVLVAPSDGYYTVRTLAEQHLARNGVEVRLVASDDAARARGAARRAAAVARVADQPAARRRRRRGAGAGRARGGRARRGRQHARDAAAPAAARPRRRLLGRERGQADHRAQRPDPRPRRRRATPARAAGLRDWRTTSRRDPGPFETWLAHRSIATLGLRVERQERNAVGARRAAAARDEDVALGRAGPASAASSRSTCSRADRAEAFLGACRLVAEATSFGGVHSSAERRARWGGDDLAAG